MSTNPTCQAGSRVKESTAYSGNSVCKFCEPCSKGEKCNCPDGKIADGNGRCVDANPCANVTCNGGKVCSAGSCVCPNSAPYTDSSGKCQPCLQDSHCGTNKYCYDNGAGARSCADDCLKICPVGYRNGGRENILQNGCSNGYLVNGKCNSGRPCWTCDTPAPASKTCAEQGYKTSCPKGYTPLKRTTGSDGTCYECICNNGYETTTPVNGYYCVPCGMKYGPCSECNATACTHCTSPYSINPTCGSSQYKYYPVPTGNCAECRDCPANCTKCTNANTCTACAPGYTLKNGKCEKVNCKYTSKAQCMSSEHTTGCTQDGNGCWNRSGECQSGYWWGNTGRTGGAVLDGCHACPSAATTCYNNKLTCKSGYALMGGGYCYKCNKNCGTCKEVGPDSCYTCASGYYTFNHRSESTPGYCCKGMHTSDITQCVYN